MLAVAAIAGPPQTVTRIAAFNIPAAT